MHASAPVRAGVNGTQLHVDGGAPLRMDGPIVLCGRSDNDSTRGYNGRLTQLALFNRALTPVEVYASFLQARGSLSNKLIMCHTTLQLAICKLGLF